MEKVKNFLKKAVRTVAKGVFEIAKTVVLGVVLGASVCVILTQAGVCKMPC